MILLEEYFNDKIGSASVEQKDSAQILLVYVNGLLNEYVKDTQRQLPINPKTGNCISGQLNGDGGFRLQDSVTGSKLSSHKEAKGIDIYDPTEGQLDEWITDTILARHYLFREHPSHTPRWTHLSTRKPPSGRRSFYP